MKHQFRTAEDYRDHLPCNECEPQVAKPSTEIRITDPKTGGQKGQKDERFDLMPFDALEEVARVYGTGAKKYADDNWLKGYSWRLSAGALLRHVGRFMLGEDYDRESGHLHLAHAAWHCMTLITFKMRALGTDDRAKPTLALPPEPVFDLTETRRTRSDAPNVQPPPHTANDWKPGPV